MAVCVLLCNSQPSSRMLSFPSVSSHVQQSLLGTLGAFEGIQRRKLLEKIRLAISPTDLTAESSIPQETVFSISRVTEVC